MPKTWMNGLAQYSYPVQLSDYNDATKFPSYFNRSILGDRDSTLQFEDYFRKSCNAIEPWYEVIFWKLFSQKRFAQTHTSTIIQHITTDPTIHPDVLLTKLNKFIQTESKEDFDRFRSLFGFSSKAIAIAATFPAFFDPINFPMVDTRIAKWVNKHYQIFNAFDSKGPKLIPSMFNRGSTSTVLTMTDFTFYLHWIHWTRHIAKKLNQLTGTPWRARDVEMAVFTAWGDRGCYHPMMKLNPI